MTRSRVRERERIRAAVQTTDPAALAAYAGALRPVVVNLWALAERSKRVHARSYLRRELLKGIRELEARIDAAAPSQ